MSAWYVLRRLLQVVPAVAAILVVTFLAIHLAPGDPIAALAGEGGDAGYYQFMREKFGLDRPLLQQFLAYVANVAQGDLGNSYVQGRPVVDAIAQRLPATLLLMATAVGVASVGGVVLGALAARRPSGPFDVGVSTTALVGYAVPVFWLAQLAMLFVAFGTGWFPIQGMTDLRADYSGMRHLLDVAHHLVLPASVLAVSEVALVSRLTRTGVVQEMSSAYVTTARANGLSPGRVLFGHALPNAMLPVVTVMGTRLGYLVSGAILVETVFAWPGLGRLLLTATQTNDHPVLLGLVLLVAFSVVAANLVTDLVTAAVDPRIRYD